MKQTKFLFVLTMLLSMVGTRALAHDIEMANADGVTIYYNWINNNTELEVGYRGNSYGTYSKEYFGNVIIPESIILYGKTYPVTSIGGDAFHDCSSLTNVTIPQSVTSIGKRAFHSCSGLTSVVIPISVTKIGDYAFTSCSGLTNMTIPNSVTSIGEEAFNDCSGLTSVTIPNSITSISNRMFYGCSGLTSVIIPSSVTSIGFGAFQNCSGLKNVIIPNSVTSIGGQAFYNCSGLKSVTIPNSVTSIGGNAFSDCKSLTSITIPNSVTSLDRTFSHCSGLTSVTIPNSVTSIGDFAFDGCSGLTSVIIPNSVTSIGKSAFQGCNGLTSVIIPNNVTSIGSSAFKYCNGLTSVTMPKLLKTIGMEAFYQCKNLSNLTIPDYVTSIGASAFANCEKLTSINIPKSVTTIGYSAFVGCVSLNSVKITDIGAWCNINFGVMDGYSWRYESMSSNPLFYAHNLFLNDKKVENLIIPNDVGSISDRAFILSNISSLVISNSVTTIGNEAFRGSNLGAATISNSVMSIGNEAFLNCSELSSITIPSSVTSIGSSAFSGCEKLTSVNFSNCNAIIKDKAFYACKSLKMVIIPNSITELGVSAFENSTGIESVTFGENVKIIRQNLFAGCTKISQVTSHIQEPLNMVKSVFADNVYTQATLTVPDGTTNKYLACDGWKDFLNIKEQGQQSSFILTISGNNGGKVVYGSRVIENGSERISVSKNQSVTLNITPNEGFDIQSVTLNGEDVTDDLYNNTYTIAQIKEDFEFVVTFAVSPLYVTIKYADGGVVKQKVEKGQVYEYKIEPADGWHIHSVTFNGKDVTSELSSKNEYKTPAITENSELYVTFEMGATNVSNFTESKMRVNAYGNAIRISGAKTGEKIAVYSADGKIVKSVKAEHGTATIVLPENQTYIVKGRQKTVKVRL